MPFGDAKEAVMLIITTICNRMKPGLRGIADT